MARDVPNPPVKLQLPKRTTLLSFAPSPDGQLIAVSIKKEISSAVLLFRAGETKPFAEELGGGPRGLLTWSGDARYLAAVGRSGEDSDVFDVREDTYVPLRLPEIRSASFARTGARLVVGNFGRLQVWDVETRKKIWDLPAAERPPRSHDGLLAGTLSLDGERVLVAGFPTRELRVYDLRSGKRVESLPGAPESAWRMFSDPTGRFVAVKGFERGAQVFDLERGKAVLPELNGPPTSLAFHPAQGTLLCAAGTELVTVDLASGKVVDRQRQTTAVARRVGFLPDGRRILGGGHGASDSFVRIEGSAQPPSRRARPVKGRKAVTERLAYERPIRALAVGADRLVISSTGGRGVSVVEVWDTAARQRRAVLERSAPDEVALLNGRSVLFAEADIREVILGRWDGGKKAKELRRPGRPQSLTLAGGAGQGIVLVEKAPAEIVDLSSGRTRWKLPDRISPNVGQVAISDDGARAAAFGIRSRVLFTYDLVRKKREPPLADAPKAASFLRLDPTHRHVALIGEYGRGVWIWELATRKRTAVEAFTQNARGKLISLAFSPDGALLAVGNSEGGLQILRFADGELCFDKKLHREEVRVLAFSPDSRRLYSASSQVIEGTLMVTHLGS